MKLADFRYWHKADIGRLWKSSHSMRWREAGPAIGFQD